MGCGGLVRISCVLTPRPCLLLPERMGLVQPSGALELSFGMLLSVDGSLGEQEFPATWQGAEIAFFVLDSWIRG